MNAQKEIENHRIPCGAVMVSIDAVCRRSLKDHFDMLLDRLTQETHPEGVDEEILNSDTVEIPEEQEPEETDEEKKARLLKEGKIKLEVKKELAAHEAAHFPEPGEKEEETEEEMKKRLIREGKLKADVRKVVQKYEDKIMPKPKPAKAKTSDHSEHEEEEEELQGNSKMLQNLSGKINKR